MNLLAPFKSAAATFKTELVKAFVNSTPFAQAFLRGEEEALLHGGTRLRTPMASPIIHACVDTIADTVAGIPLRISQGEKNAERIVTRGPAYELLQRPQPRMRGRMFVESAVKWALLRGEVIMLATDQGKEPQEVEHATRGQSKTIRELHLINPDRVRHDVSAHRLNGWDITCSPQESEICTQHVPPSMVIHERKNNPFDPWRGLSPLTAALLAAETDHAAALFQKGLLINNGSVAPVFQTDQVLPEHVRDALIASANARRRSAGTANRPLILEGGLQEVEPRISKADADMLEGRAFNRKEICAVFKVPQEVIGYREDTSKMGDGTDSSRELFFESAILPMVEMIEAFIEPIVRVIDPGMVAWFDTDSHPIMQAQRLRKVATAKTLFDMGAAFNDVNDYLLLGFKPQKHGDRNYLPMGLVDANEEPVKTPPETPDDEVIDGDVEVVEDESKAVADNLIKMLGSYDAAQKEGATSDAWAKAVRPAYKQTLKRLKNFFMGQKKRVLDRFKGLESVFQKAAKSGWVHKAEEDALWDAAAENARLHTALDVVLAQHFEQGMRQIAAEIAANIDFNLVPLDALEHLSSITPRLEGINDATAKRVKKIVATGLETGASYQETADKISKLFDDTIGVGKESFSRAETIAHTETNSAINNGRAKAINRAGVKRKGWRTSAASLEHRSAHLAEARKTRETNGIPTEEYFHLSTGVKMKHPHDPAGRAAEIVNCKCFLVALREKEGDKTAAYISPKDYTPKIDSKAFKAASATFTPPETLASDTDEFQRHFNALTRFWDDHFDPTDHECTH